MPDIMLRLVEHGECVIQVDLEGYLASKATGVLEEFLDSHASNMDNEIFIVEPDGTLIPLWNSAPMRRSVLSNDAVETLTDLLQSAKLNFDCASCRGRGWACPVHMAKTVIEAIRREDLVLLPRADIDAMVEQATGQPAADDGHDPFSQGLGLIVNDQVLTRAPDNPSYYPWLLTHFQEKHPGQHVFVFPMCRKHPDRPAHPLCPHHYDHV